MIRILAGVLTAGIVLSGCGTHTDADRNYTKKQVAAYDKDDTKPIELTCMYRDDMPNIPFVDVEQYLDLVYCEDADYTLTGSGHLYSVSGQNKNTGKTGSNLLIDTEKDLMTFEEYTGFVVGKPDGTAVDYVQMTAAATEEAPALTYDLSDYGIDLIAEDGHVFMPLSTLSDILNNSLTYADYIDGKIYLNREGSSSSDPPAYVKEAENAYFETLTREPDVAEYAYHELCFVLENLYGRPKKAASQEFVDSLSTIGLDETLEKGRAIDDVDLRQLKAYLTSTDKTEYAQGLFMLDNLLFDGGHNWLGYSFYGVLSRDENWDQTAFAREYLKKFGADAKTNVALSSLGYRFTGISNRLDAGTALRNEGFGVPEKFWYGNEGDAIAALYLFDDTAVFLFNEFSNDLILTNTGEKPFQEALDFAAENSCRNFVLDLSTNGGGSDQTMGYMLSMIYGHDASYYRLDVDTGYRKEDVFTPDKNHDGRFDEKDEEIRYDFRYAIMISDYSYSCGNTMPNLAHLEGIPLLGSSTAGGGCNVNMLTLPGECTPYRLSSTWAMTDSDYQSIDEGIAPDDVMLAISGDEIVDASLYDPDKLTAAINRYYEAAGQ